MATGIGRCFMAAGIAAATGAIGGCIIVVGADTWDDDHHAYHSSNHSKRSWAVDIDQAMLTETESVRVSVRAGDVTIEHTDGAAYARVQARGPDGDRVRKLELAVRSEGNTLHIEPEWPGDRWRDNESVDLVIALPTRDGVNIKTSTGDVAVESMRGILRVSTSAGDVEIESHDGSVHAESSAGDIWMEQVSGAIEAETSAGDIDLNDVGWPVEAITSAGDITVTLRPGFSGVLHASTSAGDIRLPGNVDHRKTGPTQSASVSLGDGEDECVFRTSSGDVSVRIENDG